MHAMHEVDVGLVTYRPDFPLLQQLLSSLAESAAEVRINLLVEDNSVDAAIHKRLRSLAHLQSDGPFARVDIVASRTNAGFGRGQNAALARGSAPFALIINQDCVLEPDLLAPLLAEAHRGPQDVAAWELRQIP